ncbi:MAG TPA: uroporphyrinogen decarboxylase family protein, partial [Candidatus Hydrogenedentes bacterium]|nr:uroporphyrinogen decarboxylase family protein [Candidatus Hydrogenedentota bacterium]
CDVCGPSDAQKPFTLLVFLVEGKSFGDRADAAFAFLREAPALAHALIEKLTAMTIDYLRFQAGCGAHALQLFESAAFLCSSDVYQEFAIPYQQRIFAALRGAAPTIFFAREWNALEDLDAAGADIISLPSSISIAQARERLGGQRVFQGNLDNALLARGAWPDIEAAARACVESGEHRGHIFNLSHGLLRETPFAHIERLVRFVHECRA